MLGSDLVVTCLFSPAPLVRKTDPYELPDWHGTAGEADAARR